MNKEILDNPQAQGFKTVVMMLNDQELAQWSETGIGHPPAGFRAFVRLEGVKLSVGIEKIPDGQSGAIKETPKSADYGRMGVGELQEACAMKGIKYDQKDNATTLRQLLAKG